MSYLIGIDLGTTNIKAVVMDTHTADVLAAADHEHAIDHPQPGYAEQHPAVWWEAVTAAVRQAIVKANVDPAVVRGIGLSGQMHGTICIGADGQPVRPASSGQRKAEKQRPVGRAARCPPTGCGPIPPPPALP